MTVDRFRAVLPRLPHLFWAAIAFFAALLVALLWLETRGIGHDELVGETGLVEISSAVLWFLAALVIGFRRKSFQSRFEPWVLLYLCSILGFRELDAHKRIFEWNLSKLYNMVKPSIPADERLAALAFLFAPLAVALWILWRVRVRRLGDPGEKGRWRGYAAGWIVLALLALGGDKLSWMFDLVGGEISEPFPARAAEESLELALALYTFAGTLAGRRWWLAEQT